MWSRPLGCGRSRTCQAATHRGGAEMARPRHTAEEIIGRLRDELLNREIFYTLREAQVLIEAWRQEYNHRRAHTALGYRRRHPRRSRWWQL